MTTVNNKVARGSNGKLRYVPEVVYAVTPAAPAFVELPFVSESLSQKHESETSEQITDDRVVNDIIRNRVRATGETNHELLYGAYDQIIAGALYADALPGAAVTNTYGDVSFATSDNSVNTAGGDFVADGYLANRWIIFKNETSGAAPIFAKIVSVATAKIILSHYDIPSDIGAGDTWRLHMPGVMKNGKLLRSATIEGEFDTADADANFKLFPGQVPGTITIGFETTGKLTLGVSWTGKREISANATAADTLTAAPDNRVLSVVDNLKAVQLDGTARTVTGISLTIENNIQEILEAGNAFASEIMEGTLQVSGQVSFYYRDAIEYDKYLAHSDSGVSFVFMDDENQGYIIDVPTVKYSDGGRPLEGQNTPVEVPLSFEARKNTTEGLVIAIYPFALP